MPEVHLETTGLRVAEFREATRIQQSFITKAEKRALRWLAERVPAAVNSDHLTALGAIGMFLAAASYALVRFDRVGLLFACLFLGVNWFGDSLDGTLARYRDRQRPRYGFYVDHVIDTFGAMFLIGGLALSGYMSERVAALLLVVFFMLAINSYLAAYTLGIFRLAPWKMGPTEIRLLLRIGNIFLLNHRSVRILGH